MKRLIFTFFWVIFITFVIALIFISTFGIETKKFNNLFSQKINENYKQISLELNTIRFKLDIKELSLFLETNNPNLDYKDINIPVKNIKAYVDFISLLKTEIKISKINIFFPNINLNQIKNISTLMKPSNFISFVNNKVIKANCDLEFEIYLQKDNEIENFITRGSVSDFEVEVIEGFSIKKASFNFFGDKTDILIKNIFGNSILFDIKDGDIRLKLFPELSLVSNFKTKINFNNEIDIKNKFLDNLKYLKNFKNLQAEINNSFSINFDKTYKVKSFDYKNYGKVISAIFDLDNQINAYFLKEKINLLSLTDSDVKMSFNKKNNSYEISGKYSLNDDLPSNFKLKNIIIDGLSKINLEAEFTKGLYLDFLNYEKLNTSKSNIKIDMNKKGNSLKVNEFTYKEGKNYLFLKGLKVIDNRFLNLDKLAIKTFNEGVKNNDFLIIFDKKIKISGEKFDANNLPKILKNKSKNNFFSKINREIEIDILNINVPLSEKLENFKLIGKIENGKFKSISSKGEFDNKNFLDISMKNDDKSKKKYLEIYSDLTKPLLTEYNFFKGLTGGKLLYSSIIYGNISKSKLRIEDFKVVNAPGMVKLLSLADLGGLADLAEGDGISFDFLEINMEKNEELLKLNEIVATGPSISVLMDGYQDSKLTSIRGTLVPAKTLNKIISKIPLIGEIVIPKEIGEGLFGISFKLKGPSGNVKTTINPVRTITPRFIQKIIDGKKTVK